MSQIEARYEWVDFAKAIGIMLVVYGHVSRGIYHAGIVAPFKLFTLVDSIVYTFHMPLFFFLAGLFFWRSFTKWGGGRLIGRKINTIVYPYIVWSIVQGSIERALTGYTNGAVTYSEIFTLLWSPRAQFWFLYILFVFFLLTVGIFSVLPQKSVVGLLIFSVVLYLYPTLLLPDTMLFRLMANNLVFFTVGIIFSLHVSITQWANRYTLYFLAAGFVVAQFVFHNVLGLTYEDKSVAALLLALLSILFIINVSVWAASPSKQWLTRIGSSSTEIYLLHILASSGVRVILKSVMGIDLFIIHLVLGCLAGIFVPMVALRMVNKLNIPYVFSAQSPQVILRGLKS